jgi:predicted adenine nucleotide alpha hydrolase (AANH) superfamily ATPase
MSEKNRLLLHACCGPCTIMPLRALTEEGWDVTIAFVNPNIQPEDEYVHRLEVLTDYAARQGAAVLEGAEDAVTEHVWRREVGCFGDDRPRRCRACYRLRLRESARIAASQDFSALSTTLAVSPYQLTDIIVEELDAAARTVGVESVFRDFRPLYPEATRISRAEGMYRQNYCGCLISKEEAELERNLRRGRHQAEVQARALEREAKRVAHADELAAQRARRDAYDELARRKRAVRDAIRAARGSTQGTASASETLTRVHPPSASRAAPPAESHADQSASSERNRA